jgi:uncharacterized protein YdhG (YjbR/CyaY superfamily)
MAAVKQKFNLIDEYILSFPKATQLVLERMRKSIKEAVPNTEEAISYGIPTFKLKGNLVHFAAYKNHIGFYPTPSGINAFKDELSNYKQSKGAIQFPLNEPLPIELIKRIVIFRVKENLERKI